MNANQTMMSAAMLEAMWGNRRKDMLDLITPFIMYEVALKTSPGEVIDIQEVQRGVQNRRGYSDMPESIVRKVLARRPFSAVIRKNRKFYLASPIDEFISKMEDKEKECDKYLHILGSNLADYLNEHCRRNQHFTEENAIDCLHIFFSRYGLQVGTDDLASAHILPKEYETDYYIARFIFECKDVNNEAYQYLKDLIKGYFLRLALYIQPENGEIKSLYYSKVTFFYATSFLLDFLRYSGKERENNARLLHDKLKQQKGSFCYFPHTKQEVVDILYAYKCSLHLRSTSMSFRTLEGLNARNYNSSDVDREIYLLESSLQRFNIVEQDVPAYDTKSDGTVDKDKILAEAEIKQYIRDNTSHYTNENLENDVKSALAIHRLRGDNPSCEIEKCRYIFVTNNYDFTRLFNKYYKSNINANTFQLIISESDLSAITWLKCGEIEKLPETELLKNAYCALQPIPEIMKKVEEILQKLKSSGQLTAEQVVALRASRVFQNEIWINSFGETDSVTVMSVQEAQRKYQEQLISDEKKRREAEERENAVKQRKLQNERNRKSADLYAKQKRAQWLSMSKCIVRIAACILMGIGIIGTIMTFTPSPNHALTVISVITLCLAVLSVFDTVHSRSFFAFRILEKWANRHETKWREAKLKEYECLTQNQGEAN